MGIGTSIVLVAVGAILRFAVTAHATGFNIQTIGLIIMLLGLVGFVVSLCFWSSWGGFGDWGRGRTVVTRTDQDVMMQPARRVVTRTEAMPGTAQPVQVVHQPGYVAPVGTRRTTVTRTDQDYV
jgi:hypothetical protein